MKTIVLTVNVVEENADKVGSWGGTCRCPDGKEYEVGDNKNSCKSLACINGLMINCNEYKGSWTGRKVTCASK